MEFQGDDGSLEYAKAAGIYVKGLEAPIIDDRCLQPAVDQITDRAVIFSFGQSNAANSGEGCYVATNRVNVFNVFDMKYYRAVDPLPGASNNGASVWGRLGDKLISADGGFRCRPGDRSPSAL